MNRFRVGDKVRLVRPDEEDIGLRGMAVGQEFTVAAVDEDGDVYVDWDDCDCILLARQLELAPSSIEKAAPKLLEAAAMGHQDAPGLPCGDLLAAANVLRNHGYKELAAALEAKHAAEMNAIAEATGEE